MEVYRRSSGLLLLLGLSLLATTLQGVQGEVELEGPSESECRPYIEKALKELETGEVAEGSLADQGDSKEDIPTVEITDDSDHHDGDGEIDDANEDGQENKENEIISEKKLEPEVRHSFLQKLSSFFQKIFHKTPSKKEEAANERKRSEDKQDDASVERGDQPSVDNEESKEENEGDSKEGESKEDESKEIDSTGAEVKDDDSKEGDDNDEIEIDKDDDKEKQADSVEQLKEETDDEQKDDDDDSKEENEKVAESDEQTDDQQKDDEDDNKSELEKESVEEVFEAVEAQRLMQGQDDQEGDSKEEDQDDAEEIPQADEAKSEEDVQEDDSKEDLKGVPQEDTKDDSKEENREEIKDDTQEDSNEETKDDSERETKDSKEGVQDDSKIDDEESGKDDSEEHDKDDSKEKETTTKEETADSKEDVTESKEIQGADKSEENAGMQDSQEDDKNEKEDDDKKDEESAEDVLASKEDDKDDNKEESVEDKDDKSDEKTVAKKEKDDEDSTENDETRQSYEDGGPVEELSLDTEIPTDLRPRDHVEQLLKLDDESSESENLINKVSEITLRDLKKLYENAIKPLEVVYKYRDLSNRHFGDSEIFSKPLILFMGPWSGGKSSIINYLTNNEYNETSLRTGAEPSPAYFNILTYGEEPEVIDGTELAVDFTFSGLQKFGQGLEERLRGLKLPSKLLEKVNIVEIPGILEVRKQVSRVFPFNDACQWFIDRGDIIFLVYDPSKLDVGPETEAILDQLKGREHQTRIILNKADQVKPEELMRVQGALIWNISPLMSSPQPPIMYTTSLWSRPYESWAPVRLLQAQERAFLRDLRGAIDKRIENKIASARRFAVRVRNHAKMVDCYLTTYYNHKSVFGNRKQVADAIIEHPQDYHIYEGLSTLTNISRYDLPDPDVYRDFFKLNPLYEFQQLSATCTYFRGCPINRLDIAIAYDLPELLGTHKKRVESALIEAAAPQADAGQQKSAPGS